MTPEEWDAKISKAEADLAEFGRQSDGTVAQMTQRIEAEKQQMQARLDALVREHNAQQVSFREEYLRREGRLSAWKEQRDEEVARQGLQKSELADIAVAKLNVAAETLTPDQQAAATFGDIVSSKELAALNDRIIAGNLAANFAATREPSEA